MALKRVILACMSSMHWDQKFWESACSKPVNGVSLRGAWVKGGQGAGGLPIAQASWRGETEE